MSQQQQQPQQVLLLQQFTNCNSLMRRPVVQQGKQRNLEISSSYNSYSFHQEPLLPSSMSTKNNSTDQSHIAPGRKYSFDVLNIPSIGTKISLSDQNKKQRQFQQPPSLQLYDVPESNNSDSSSWVNSLGDQYCLTGQSPSQASNNQHLLFQSNQHVRYSSLPSPSGSQPSLNPQILNQGIPGQFSSTQQNYFEGTSSDQVNQFNGLSQERLSSNTNYVNQSTNISTQNQELVGIQQQPQHGYHSRLRKVPKIRCSAQYGNGQCPTNETNLPPSTHRISEIQRENNIGNLYAPSSEQEYPIKTKGSNSTHESPTYQQHSLSFKPVQYLPQKQYHSSNNQASQQPQQQYQQQQNQLLSQQISSQNLKGFTQQQQIQLGNPQGIQYSQIQSQQISQLKPSQELNVKQTFCQLNNIESKEQQNSQQQQQQHIKQSQEPSFSNRQSNQYILNPDTRNPENNILNRQQQIHLNNQTLRNNNNNVPFAQLTNRNTIDQRNFSQFDQQLTPKQQHDQYFKQTQINLIKPQQMLQVRQQNEQSQIGRREQISQQQETIIPEQYNYRTNSYCKNNITTQKVMNDMTAILANRCKPPLKKNQEKLNENINQNYPGKDGTSQGTLRNSYQGTHNILKQDIVVSLGAKGKENINHQIQEKKPLISRKESTKIRIEGRPIATILDPKEERSFSLDATKISKALDTTFNYSDLLQLSLSELDESSKSQIFVDQQNQNINQICLSDKEQDKLDVQRVIEVRKRHIPETFTFNTYISQSQNSNNNSWECDKQQQQSSLKADSQGSSESTNDQHCEILKQSEKQQDLTGEYAKNDESSVKHQINSDLTENENDEVIDEEEYANILYQQLTIERSLFQMKTCLTRLMSQLLNILPPIEGEDLMKFQIKLKNILALKLSLEELKMIFVSDKTNNDIISREEVLDVLLGSQSLMISTESQELAADTKKIIRNILRETRRAEIHLKELRQKYKYCQGEIFKIIAGDKTYLSCSDLGIFFKSNGFDVRDQETMLLIYRFHRKSTIRLLQINFQI